MNTQSNIRNKKKTINDPVLGFNSLQSELLFDLMEHPYFQRLRRIKQLGLSCMVYPGANHTRFEHALGTTFLMQSAVASLQSKGVEITPEESEAVKVAILLHDIGHGPFSHALEYAIVDNLVHEQVSLLLMEELNIQFNGKLSLAIAIFKNEYHKKFLHQLVSSQLDIDRLDYLRRDSFYSGVAEGAISADRIIKMMNVTNNELVIEEKAIYSIEKFLISRRLMYWQVYLHKTVLSAEILLEKTLKRAKELALAGTDLFATPSLKIFLSNKISLANFNDKDQFMERDLLSIFAGIEDDDIIASIKQWQNHDDYILSHLAKSIINRKLYKVQIQSEPASEAWLNDIKEQVRKSYGVSNKELDYFVIQKEFTNKAYMANDNNINILMKNGEVKEFSRASDISLSNLSQVVRKYVTCFASYE
ncbi:MAG: HD domain-containing protein [Mangrovibacterium sp.]